MFSPRHAPSYRSRLEALVTLPLRPSPPRQLDTRLFIFQGRSNMSSLITGFSFPPKSQVTLIDLLRPVILTLILIFCTQTPHQTLIRPERARLLVGSAHTPY
jgi:hypothetical protein